MRTDDGGLIGRIQRSSLGYMNTMHTQKLLKRGVISFCWMIPSIMAVRRSTAKVLASAKFITLNSYPLPLGLGLDIYNDYTR